ncbi:2',3'-cyclic-nucleotide 2'-phosphodiesterase/3'-nucleotidase [Ureibacillus chungkukjangi]|uniref:2',3'-cyclic-nucleotide 2'-phosphodiesterase/3'-nucleotidase n=1 Tax=Ureibacillus chungkukjangi TaxID=1202712 RepID=A0A318TQR8_9BACL|nr:2',3'-cyclic-nucleotide 2'-phosphodiesterase/3'-nucleotidase [Ureibacillus chungkukjangi]
MKNMSFSILVTSDIHGRLDRFEKLVKQMKSLNADLVIDNGDFLDGSPATFYYQHIQKSQHPMIELANQIYDIAILGNHEFHNSLLALEKLRSDCRFPWISCNIKDFAKPYYVQNINEKKFVIVGATTHFTPMWDEHGYVKELIFEDALKALHFWVDYVKEHEKPDYLIVSYHGGFSEDPSTEAVFQARTGENQANEILETIQDIDLLITGHQHLYINTRLQNTLIIQPTSHSNGFFEVQIDFEEGHSHAIFHQLEDSQFSYPAEVEEWLDQELTYIQDDYSYKGLLSSRLSSHPFIQLTHDMQLKATNAEISVCDLLYLEKGGFKGSITNRVLLKNSPREHKLQVISLSGAEIKELMELSAAVLALNKAGEIDFSTNVFPGTQQAYQYDFWGGISYVFDVKEPVGQRVQEIVFEGKPLGMHQHYQVVFNSYRLTGVDFPLLKNREILYEATQTVPFLFKGYLQACFPKAVPNHGHFKVRY